MKSQRHTQLLSAGVPADLATNMECAAGRGKILNMSNFSKKVALGSNPNSARNSARASTQPQPAENSVGPTINSRNSHRPKTQEKKRVMVWDFNKAFDLIELNTKKKGTVFRKRMENEHWATAMPWHKKSPSVVKVETIDEEMSTFRDGLVKSTDSSKNNQSSGAAPLQSLIDREREKSRYTVMNNEALKLFVERGFQRDPLEECTIIDQRPLLGGCQGYRGYRVRPPQFRATGTKLPIPKIKYPGTVKHMDYLHLLGCDVPPASNDPNQKNMIDVDLTPEKRCMILEDFIQYDVSLESVGKPRVTFREANQDPATKAQVKYLPDLYTCHNNGEKEIIRERQVKGFNKKTSKVENQTLGINPPTVVYVPQKVQMMAPKTDSMKRHRKFTNIVFKK